MHLLYIFNQLALQTLQVTMKGEMLNMYTDEQGEQQTALVGNIYDLRSKKIKEIGGVPIEKIQAHYEIQRDRAGRKDRGFPDRVVGFPEQSTVPLPPDTVKVYEVRDEQQETGGTTRLLSWPLQLAMSVLQLTVHCNGVMFGPMPSCGCCLVMLQKNHHQCWPCSRSGSTFGCAC